ncbi:MAG TPA: hypothetical protein VMV45_08975, partial [Casimicrobiaceae bacterium]|nr:hypothetical protein [Casimicrobiaceae bacterium]
MAYVASAVARDRPEASDQVEWFRRFRVHLRATQTRLSSDDERKLDDFGRDIEGLRGLSDDADPASETALGRFHARFERVFDRRRGRASQHRVAGSLSPLHPAAPPVASSAGTSNEARSNTRDAAAEGQSPALPSETSALLEPFRDEYRLLDRLSLRYGGLYRGVILVNYALALLAGLLAILEQIAEHWLVRHDTAPAVASESTSLVQWLATSGKGFAVTFAGLEVLLIVVGVLLFLRGYTPSPGHKPPKALRDWCARRWHERWIEYRLLAERFRYAMLLEPFAGTTAVAWRNVIVNPGETPSWPDRYFRWRIENGEPSGADRQRWWEWLIAT